MKLNKSNTLQITPKEIWNVIGKEFQLTIGKDFIEIPDTLSVAELDAVKALLYLDATAFNTMTDSQKIVFLAKKLGVLP